MKILILGGSGMIGHRMWADLATRHEVYATVRKSSLEQLSNLDGIDPERAYYNVEALNFSTVRKVVEDCRPDVVLNCIGIVKQIKEAEDPILCIELNALFPHKLARLCEEIGSRMIQFSTDCVFDGKKGNYTEEDDTNAKDLYGKSKALGEVYNLKNVLTIRTSTIGREVNLKGGLLEWFLSQEGKKVSGFSKAIYSGFPTHTLSQIMDKHILPHPELWGIYHISSPEINKFDLLCLIKEEMKLNIQIENNSSFSMERGLDSKKFSRAVGFKKPSWNSIINDIKKNQEFYQEVRNL